MTVRVRFDVFAVEDTTAQVVWRGLREGVLRLHPNGAPPVTVQVAPGQRVGAVTVGDLPPGREVTIAASGSAVGEPMSFAVVTRPRLPGEELARVATVGDLHLGARAFGYRHTITEDPEPEVAHPFRCTTAALREATEWGTELVVAKGDITNNGQVHQWRSFAQLVDQAEVPVLAVPGNHDRAFRSGLSPEDAAVAFGFEMASPMTVVDGPGHRLVLVDSSIGAHNRGRIDVLTDDLADAVAEVDRQSTVLVFMHHQFHRWPVQEGWPVGVDRQAAVGVLDRLADTGRRIVISSGHTHRHRRWDHRGVVCTQVGSTKDFPGVWAGYVISEGGVRQVVRRVEQADCISWTDHTRRAAAGTWRWVAPGSLAARCFDLLDPGETPSRKATPP